MKRASQRFAGAVADTGAKTMLKVSRVPSCVVSVGAGAKAKNSGVGSRFGLQWNSDNRGLRLFALVLGVGAVIGGVRARGRIIKHIRRLRFEEVHTRCIAWNKWKSFSIRVGNNYPKIGELHTISIVRFCF